MTCKRKQARRTGMAGPLGEMFDHGALTSCIFHFHQPFSCQVATHSTQQYAFSYSSSPQHFYFHTNTARVYLGFASFGTRTFVVDGRLSNRHLSEFLLDHLGRISYRFVNLPSSNIDGLRITYSKVNFILGISLDQWKEF